jgi:hypothetical protein
MQRTIAAIYAVSAFYLVLVAIGIVVLLVVLWRLFAPRSRASAVDELKIGLLGGLIVTSSPFWWLALPLLGAQSMFVRVPDLIHSGVFGWSRYFPGWLPNFLIGFWMFVGLWLLIRTVTRRATRAA